MLRIPWRRRQFHQSHKRDPFPYIPPKSPKPPKIPMHQKIALVLRFVGAVVIERTISREERGDSSSQPPARSARPITKGNISYPSAIDEALRAQFGHEITPSPSRKKAKVSKVPQDKSKKPAREDESVDDKGVQEDWSGRRG